LSAAAAQRLLVSVWVFSQAATAIFHDADFGVYLRHEISLSET
jgi:hypothetical protein